MAAAVFIRIILKLFCAGAKSNPVPHPTFTKGITMNARKILNPELRNKIAHLTLKEIRELLPELERDVFQLQIFLKLASDKKLASRRSPPKTPRGGRLWN
jgi:hypothetical protein